MTDGAVVAFAAAILVGDELLTFEVIHDFARDAGSIELADFEVCSLADCEHVFEFDTRAFLTDEFLDGEDFAGADAVLFTACFENCV